MDNNNYEYNENRDNKSKKKGLMIRVTAGVLGVCTLFTMGYVLIRERNKKIVKDASFLEIYEYCSSDDNNRRDMSDVMYSDLELVERYLNASNNIYSIYEDYNGQISNLEFGSVKEIDNQIVFMSDEEFSLLESNIELVMDNYSSLTYDERMQLVGEVVSKSANVNAFLYFKGYEILRHWLSVSIADDAAIMIGVDNNLVNCKIVDDDMYVSRRDDDNGFAYDVLCKGRVINNLEDTLMVIEGRVNSALRFVNGEINSIFYDDESVIVYLDENSNLCVSYNEGINKEINGCLNEIKLLFFRDSKIGNDVFRYSYWPNNNMVDSFSESKSKVLSK